jgi:hypothetical protein
VGPRICSRRKALPPRWLRWRRAAAHHNQHADAHRHFYARGDPDAYGDADVHADRYPPSDEYARPLAHVGSGHGAQELAANGVRGHVAIGVARLLTGLPFLRIGAFGL